MGSEGLPLCEEHAREDTGARSLPALSDDMPEAAAPGVPAAPVNPAPQTPQPPLGSRTVPGEALAVVLGVAAGIVGGAVGAGVFYTAASYTRGEGESLGGGYESVTTVVAIVLAVVVFVLVRKALSDRYRLRSQAQVQTEPTATPTPEESGDDPA